MKTWWLKLYTYPNIQQAALFFGAWLGVDILCYFLPPGIRMVNMLIYIILLVYVTVKPSKDIFRDVEFLMVSINPKSLRSIVFKEFSLTFFASTSIGLAAILLSSLYGGAWAYLKDILAEEVGSFSTFCLYWFGAYFFAMMKGIFSAPSFEQRSRIKRYRERSLKGIVNFFYKGFFYYAFAFVGLMVIVLLSGVSDSTGLGLWVTGYSVLFAMCAHQFNVVFHKPFREGTKWTSVWYQCGRTLFIHLPQALLFIVLMYPIYYVETKVSSMESRGAFSTFMFWGKFAKPLTEEQFHSYKKVAILDEEHEQLIKRAPASIRSKSFEELYPNATLKQMRGYLKKGRVKKEDILYMSTLLNADFVKRSSDAYAIASDLYWRWPHHEPMPEYIKAMKQ